MVFEQPQDFEVVYAWWPGDEDSSLIFIRKSQALKLAKIELALKEAKTWGEFKSKVDEDVYEEVIEMLLEGSEQTPSDSEPFSADDIPGYADGDWPSWPAQEMLDWVPKEIQQQYGKVESSVHNGPFLEFSPSQENDLVQAFGQFGYRCVKDERLVRSTYGDFND